VNNKIRQFLVDRTGQIYYVKQRYVSTIDFGLFQAIKQLQILTAKQKAINKKEKKEKEKLVLIFLIFKSTENFNIA